METNNNQNLAYFRIMQVMRGRHHQSELVVVRIVRFDFLYLELYEKNVICKGWGYAHPGIPAINAVNGM